MSTPSYTRDSFNPGALYVEVTFQFNKNVLDSELNELQRNVRVQQYRQGRVVAGDMGGAMGDGMLVTSDGATNNQLVIKAGIYIFRGYAIEILSDTNVTGLSTPGMDRVDTAWMKMEEVFIDNTDDTAIGVSQLGQTTQRRKLKITFGVTEGAATAPDDASPNQPWADGVRATVLATIYRTGGAALITTAMIVDKRPRLARLTEAQDRNTFVSVASDGFINWNGTDLQVENLQIRIPFVGQLVSGDFTLAPADGDCIGWSGAASSWLRRKLNVAITALTGTEAAAVNAMTKQAFTSDLTANDGLWLLALRIGNQIMLRDGTVLNAGDRLRTWGQAVSQRETVITHNQPLLRFLDSAGNGRFLVDHNGFPGGRFSEFREEWLMDYSVQHGGDAGSAGAGKVMANYGRWRVGCKKGDNTAGDGYVSSPGTLSSVLGSRYMFMTNHSGNTNGDKVWCGTLSPVFRMNSNLVMRAEWEGDVGYTDTTIISMGFFGTDPAAYPANTADTNGRGHIAFQTTGITARWWALYGTDAGTTNVDTMVDATPGTFQRFRIEVHGTASALAVALGAANPVVRYFINEALVATTHAANPPLNGMTFFYALINTAGVGDTRFLLSSPLVITFGRYLSLPSL